MLVLPSPPLILLTLTLYFVISLGQSDPTLPTSASSPETNSKQEARLETNAEAVPGRNPQASWESTGGSVGCPEAGQPWGELEWAVQLRPEVTEVSMFGYEYKRTLEKEELVSVANSLAANLGLDGEVRHVDQFRGVFVLRYNLIGYNLTGDHTDSMESRRLRRRSSHQHLARLEKGLDEHPSIVWAARQRCLVRQKRDFELDFNDPMFDRQWHLVSSLHPL